VEGRWRGLTVRDRSCSQSIVLLAAKNQLMNAQYTTTVTSSGGREGHVRSADGVLDLQLSMPKELGGSGKPGTTNPEQLFAAGYAACFENGLLRAARERKVRPTGSSVSATVGIGRREDGRFRLEVTLTVKLDGVERAKAEALARAAHDEICPYSRAVRSNVDVAVRVA
jgi:osmotically inducible protein OsmC